jgi:hypothetical protein
MVGEFFYWGEPGKSDERNDYPSRVLGYFPVQAKRPFIIPIPWLFGTWSIPEYFATDDPRHIS